MKTKNITTISIFTSIAIVLSIIESYFAFIGDIIPGIKLGLANIVIIFVLYKYNFKVAFGISLVRVFVVALIRTGFGINFFFSLVGAIFSVISMWLVKRTKLSIIGVSIIGSICHSIGQIIVGIIFLNNYNVIYYLPYLLLFSIITGIFVGVITKRLFNYTDKII